MYYQGITTGNESYTTNPDGTTTYKGDSWILYVDGVESSSYASNIALNTGNKIVFDYKTVSYTY